MEDHSSIDAVEEVTSKSSPAKQVEKEAFDPSKADAFGKAVDKATPTAVSEPVAAQEVAQPSPMDVAKQQYQQGSSNPSLANIEQTTTQINSRIEEIKDVLNHPDVTVRKSYEGLLENKLGHIDESLRVALDKAGLEYVPDGATEGIPNAIEKFLGFLTRSQKHLDSIGGEIANLRVEGREIHPADLLAVQVKVNFVQQEMELFTNLLNKGLESTKTLLNVQV